jgi:hypothetical protein
MATTKRLTSRRHSVATRALLTETGASLKRPSPREDVLRVILSDPLHLYFTGKISLESLLQSVYWLCEIRQVKTDTFIIIAVEIALAGKRMRRRTNGNKVKHSDFLRTFVCKCVDQERVRRLERGEIGGRDADCRAVSQKLKKELNLNLTPDSIRSMYSRRKTESKKIVIKT